MVPKTIPLLASTALALAVVAQPALATDDDDETRLRMLVVTDRDGTNENRYDVDDDGERTWVGGTRREYVPDRDAFDEDVSTSLDVQQSLPGLRSRLIEVDTFPDRDPEVSVVHPSDYAGDLQAIDDMTRDQRSTDDDPSGLDDAGHDEHDDD